MLEFDKTFKRYKALLFDTYLDLILQMILDLASLIFVAAFLMQLSLYKIVIDFVISVH